MKEVSYGLGCRFRSFLTVLCFYTVSFTTYISLLQLGVVSIGMGLALARVLEQNNLVCL